MKLTNELKVFREDDQSNWGTKRVSHTKTLISHKAVLFSTGQASLYLLGLGVLLIFAIHLSFT